MGGWEDGSRASCRGWRCALGGVALVSALVVGGCSTASRTTLTDEELVERGRTEAQATAETFKNAVDRMLTRTLRNADGRATVDVLAISGGGDFGAFGAGFLVGWGSAPEEARRPEFTVVTGVSTGALLAPFAFIGTDESCLEVESFYRNPKHDWVSERRPLFFWPTNPSFMEIKGLVRDVRGAVDKEMVAELAEQGRQGRVLVVSATDLDLGRQKLWDVSAEAAKADSDAAVARVQDMFLASAAIPAVFPPVEIDGGFYADGGVTANVLLRLDVKNPHAFVPRWKAEHSDRPFPRFRYWVIINNQIQPNPKMVQLKWPSIVGPSLATSIRSATMAEVRWLAAEADYVNLAFGTDIEVRVVSIPNDWVPPVEGEFQRETMESLAELGRTMGRDPNSWTLWTTHENHSGRR
ncbi:MAG: patatin-like phospholipase family protein [Phycisphaeraceae bacterium]|nr:patatin-like phospholipase family protein [Phycisphaeraceae bacterium]